MAAALLALLGLLVYAGGARATGFIRDDYYVIHGGALLARWHFLPKLLSTGYWQSALGAGAPVAEYRPLLMLSYFLNLRLLGGSAASFHLVNALLHAGVVAALYLVLRRRVGARAAAAAAALFAVLPVHTEAVAYISGRSELLSALFLLLCWRDLEDVGERPGRGLLWYALALLSKEQSVVLPVLLAMDDWTRGGAAALRRRRALYGALLGLTAGYLALRAVILPDPFHGGYDYFLGVSLLPRLLTVARFWCFHYLAPMASGVGLCSDYSRPLIPDSGAGDPAAWLCLLFWVSLAAWSALAVWRRKPAGLLFWVFFLPLAPTSHLLIKLDTLGAERFLYLPSVAFCAAAALLWERLPARGRVPSLAAVVLAFAGLTLARAQVWQSPMSYYRAAVRENPVSAGARSGLGVELALSGKTGEAQAAFRQAVSLNPSHPAAWFNLAKLAWQEGRVDEARRDVEQSMRLGLVDSDALVLRGNIAEKQGAWREAAADYARAEQVRPWDALAHFNMGRLLQAAGRAQDAAREYRRYTTLSPDAPDAAQVSALAAALEHGLPAAPKK